MTATELPGRVDLSSTGSTPPARSIETRRPRCSTRMRCGAATANSPKAARSSSTPARSLAARPRTSSSSMSRRRRSHLVGRRQPAALGGSLRGPAREGHRAPWRSGRALRRRRLGGRRPDAPDRGARHHRAPVPRALCEHDVHRAAAPRSRRRSEPQSLVLHAPDLEADPEEDGTRTGTFVVLHPGRTELLVGGTFYAGEIKKSIFTVMNDRLPLEGVFPMHCSANVGEDGRRRGLLRALRNRQNDALRRPRALADRRRRARLGRPRRLQYRRRLLREGDPPLPRRRAGDLRDDAHVRDDPRERRRSTSAGARPRRRLEDREHARGLQARADRQRAAARSRPAIPSRSSSSPPMRSGSCRRSRSCRATRRSTTSSPGSPPSSPGPRSASPSRSRRSRPASASRSCRSRLRCTRACSARSSTRTAPTSGS